MNPEQFVSYWHACAGLDRPRFIPDTWQRTAAWLMEKGFTAEDLRTVASHMQTQQRRAMDREPGAVGYNAASYGWRKMFGDFGASDQGERFVEILAAAQKAAKPSRKAHSQPVQAPRVSDAEREAAAARVRAMREQFGETGGNR